ncbi:MAG: 4-(cytidine 5'-diphospho)-2-C-methyl-D-erythritol kinase [Desulfuromonadaceae bacterium]
MLSSGRVQCRKIWGRNLKMTMHCFMAPAKINLCLHVLGRRSNGYHDLSMLMQKVSLYDEVRIGIRSGTGVRVECDGVRLQEGEVNIAMRAAEALLSHIPGTAPGIDIHIEKYIPIAAGLGGGSSNAATVLVALDKLLDLNLNKKRLARLALELGADVPFFLGSSPAWAEGVGEVLTPLEHELPKFFFVLVNPGIALSTAQVYRRVERYTICPTRDRIITNFEELVSVLHNDLEPAALQLSPEVGRVKAALLENGARGALMSGSGSTVFGVFESHADANKAAELLKLIFGWWTRVVVGVS